MRKISGNTFYFKKLFPFLWFGFLGLSIVNSLRLDYFSESPMFLVFPLAMAVFGFIFFKKFLWDLADEVYDDGDSLLFKKGRKQQRVFLQDIVNISHGKMSSPHRVTLQVRSTGDIGKELVFNPPMRLIPFSRNSLVSDLIERVDRARNNYN